MRDGERFTFTMCNPPFFERLEEAGQNPGTAFSGTAAEMTCAGGEAAFVLRMLRDSLALRVRAASLTPRRDTPDALSQLPHGASMWLPATASRARGGLLTSFLERCSPHTLLHLVLASSTGRLVQRCCTPVSFNIRQRSAQTMMAWLTGACRAQRADRGRVMCVPGARDMVHDHGGQEGNAEADARAAAHAPCPGRAGHRVRAGARTCLGTCVWGRCMRATNELGQCPARMCCFSAKALSLMKVRHCFCEVSAFFASGSCSGSPQAAGARRPPAWPGNLPAVASRGSESAH